MRSINPIILCLLAFAGLARTAAAADAEGCVDLKLLPRLEGCSIQECSAKQHESFETGAGSGPLDGNTNSLVYACPAGELAKMQRDFEARLRKAGYLSMEETNADPASRSVTARKGSQWLQWNAIPEDGATSYTLTTAKNSSEKSSTEACGAPPVWTSFKQCEVVECISKAEDSVALRTAQKAETSLTGAVETITLACPAMGAAQAFAAIESELKSSGFEILFQDREHPESAWMTGRAGQRWVELGSAPDGESVSYALTLVQSGEVLTVATPEPAPAPPAAPVRAATPAATPAPPPEPAPAPAPKPVQAQIQAPEPTSPPEPTPATPSLPAPVRLPAVATATTGFVPPKPVLQVPIEATHDRIYSVQGDVVINLLVDIAEDGTVTKAALTGRITNDVLKLESAALEAVSHWRFDPARQDGRVVPAAKIPVQMHFHGRPWRF